MPGYRSGKSRPCPRRQRRGMRLLLCPSLLLLLAESESHGYELYDHLTNFGFDLDCLDSSIVYRDLRDMEDMGFIESRWDEDSKGPKRRVYRIIEEGYTKLGESIEILSDVKDRINSVVLRYQKIYKKELT